MVEGVLFSERVEMRLPTPLVQSQKRSQRTRRIRTELVVTKSIERGVRNLDIRSADLGDGDRYLRETKDDFETGNGVVESQCGSDGLVATRDLSLTSIYISTLVRS